MKSEEKDADTYRKIITDIKQKHVWSSESLQISKLDENGGI